MEKISLLQLTEGLKPTYEKSILELEQLKKYMQVSIRKVQDYSLNFWQNDSIVYGIGKPELVILYKVAKSNKFNKKFPPSLNVLNMYGGDNIGYFYRNLNDRYKIISKYDASVFDQESFHSTLKKAINSKFYKNIYKTIATDDGYINIFAHGIYYKGCCEFYYIAAKNQIFIKNMSDEQLQEPIVPVNELNDYQHKKVINNLRIYYPFEIVRTDLDNSVCKIVENKNKNKILQI